MCGSETPSSSFLEPRLHLLDKTTNQNFLIDSGAAVSVLPASKFRGDQPQTHLVLYAANSSQIKTYGTEVLSPDFRLRRDLSWSFFIADVPIPIIGADFLKHFALLVDLKNQQIIDSTTSLTSKGLIIKTHYPGISTIHSGIACADLLEEFIEITRPSPDISSALKKKHCAHRIITNGHPVFAKCRKLADVKAAAAKAEIQHCLNQGIIRPSSSPWASPIHVVPKKDFGWRLCGDYQKLNAITQPDKYPPPLIQSLFPLLYGKSVFSTMDLERAYYQIPMLKDDIKKTAITTPWGLYEYLVMPFGLKNATQTFQRYIDSVFRGLDFVFVYIDDILVMSEDEGQHQEHLRQVFQRLQEHSLSININKCHFVLKEVNFLGYTINPNGFSPTADRLFKITEYTKPQTVHELRRFLGMVNYYRKCIPKMADLQLPLLRYIKQSIKNDKTKIVWTSEAEESFKKLKQTLADATQASFPSPNSKLTLTTDASTTCIGAALEQMEDDVVRPVGFFSRKLSETEKRYSTYDRELLAIFASIKHFRHHLECRHFTVRTDHKPLTHAFTQKLASASERQLRQLDLISQFTTDIVYVKGAYNVVADALSRINALTMPTIIDPETIQLAQHDDEELKDLIQSDSSLKLQELEVAQNVKLFCDISQGIVRPYLPQSLRRTAFDVVHNLSHPSQKVTSHQLREKFVWPKIKKDATVWARECVPCQKSKVNRYNRLLPNHIEVPDSRFSHVHLDLIVLPRINDYQYCLTIIDRFTRWPVAVPLKDMTAETVVTSFFDHWISHYGTPTKITTDQGSQFESQLFKAFASFIGAQKIRTTTYHPQSNGLVERFHRTLKAALMCSPKPWIEILSTVMLGLRTSFKEDLQASPAEILYGTSLRIPGEFFISEELQPDPQPFLEKHREFVRGLRPTPTAHHIKSRVFILKDLYTSSHVFVRCDHVKAPLEAPYTGPFKVIERISDRLFKIDVNGIQQNISVSRLKPAYISKIDSPEDATAKQSQPTQIAVQNQSSSPIPPPRIQPLQIPSSQSPPTKQVLSSNSSCSGQQTLGNSSASVSSPTPPASPNQLQPHLWGSSMDQPLRTYSGRKVTFKLPSGSYSGGSSCGGLRTAAPMVAKTSTKRKTAAAPLVPKMTSRRLDEIVNRLI